MPVVVTVCPASGDASPEPWIWPIGMAVEQDGAAATRSESVLKAVPDASATVTVTLKVEPADEVGVPAMMPLEESMTRAVGKPAADHTLAPLPPDAETCAE